MNPAPRYRPWPDESWPDNNGMLLLTFSPAGTGPLTDSPAVAAGFLANIMVQWSGLS